MTKEKDQVSIRISGLSNGVHDYHFSVNPADLSLPEEFRTPVRVDVTLDKESRQILLRARIAADSVPTCDRCLEQFETAIASEISLFFVYSDLDTGKYPADEVRVITPDTPTIDITDDVRQSIVLSVPLKLLCREDCKGLCPQCGANWNDAVCDCEERGEIDPRWENLRNIL